MIEVWTTRWSTPFEGVAKSIQHTYPVGDHNQLIPNPNYLESSDDSRSLLLYDSARFAILSKAGARGVSKTKKGTTTPYSTTKRLARPPNHL
jgi:hypothetical protein